MKIAYEILCSVTGKRYIGSTIRPINIRWSEHKSKLHNRIHPCKEMQQDWQLYGESSFSVSPKPEKTEQQWIDFYLRRNLYNRRLNNVESNNGYRHSEKTKKLISQKLKGRDLLTPEKREQARQKLKGLKKSKEWIDKIVESRKANYKRNTKWQKLNRTKDRRLSDQDAKYVKDNPDGKTYSELGEKFGVSASAICRIRQGKTYSEIS